MPNSVTPEKNGGQTPTADPKTTTGGAQTDNPSQVSIKTLDPKSGETKTREP
jgi:hypothetical protein